jgi:DNA-binding transcriptional regulator YdaS (Cro superfamily)
VTTRARPNGRKALPDHQKRQKIIAGEAMRLILGNSDTVLAVAVACGITRQAVHQWQEVPHRRVLTVARVIGLKPHEIRPDFYPTPE